MSTEKNNFYKKYNYLQMDKYLIDAEKIKNLDEKKKFWSDLLTAYNKDLNELKNINVMFGVLASLDDKLRYKQGGLLSADFKTFCLGQIDQINGDKKIHLI